MLLQGPSGYRGLPSFAGEPERFLSQRPIRLPDLRINAGLCSEFWRIIESAPPPAAAASAAAMFCGVSVQVTKGSGTALSAVLVYEFIAV